MKIFRSLLPTLVLSALAMPAMAAVRPCDPPIGVTPNALTTATTGIAYSQTMTASGGTAYTFSITQGLLPPGFALTNPTATTVDVAGMPTTAGTFAFTLTARNTPNGCSGGRAFALLVNDRTVVTTTAGTTAFVENGSPVVVDAGVTVTDSDSPNLASATITITNPQDGAAEVLAATACAGLTVTPGLNSLSITGAQPPATYQTCLRSVTYHDSSRNPGVTPRVVSFVANDGTANSAPANKTVTVAAVNDPPVANPISPPAFPEDTASTITLSYTDAEGDLATTCAVTSPTNVTVSTPCSCTAGACSVGVTGAPANYNGAASFSYTVTANGQTSNSATASLTISAVNDAPTVTTSAGTTAFTEDGGAVIVDGGVAVADVDNANFASATVTITNPADGASEVLSATACPGLTVTPGTNNLSITGSQPLAIYQTCLRSVRYNNTSQNPGTTARVVAFVVNDGALASAAANKSVSVAAVNDPPVVTTTAGTTVFVVGGGPVVVDSGLTVTDPDDTNLASGTVNITNPVNGASEVLAATACAGLTVTPGLNSLSISGNQPLATYQSCLRSVSYNNTAVSPGTAARTVRFVVNDGDVNSANADRQVDAAPRVTGTTPANGTINVGPASNVVVSFSEPVNVTASSFTIECPVGTIRPYAFVGGTTNVSSVTLDPTANLPNGQICTVTVVGAQVSDSDPADPPDTVGANVVFSFGVPPDAVNDLYPDTIVGNVRVSSGARTPPYTTTANDVSALAFTITAFDAVTAQGGQVTMTTSGAGLGQLVYNPPAGFEGNDTFTYTIANAGGSDIATVTVPVGGMIWFVQNGAPNCTTRVNGCGRLTNPYSSLPSFQAENNGTNPTLNPANGDRVFVYENATSYAGPVTLLADQRFIGQDATSSLAVLAALTPPSGSDALPAMNSGNGTFTTITNGAGNGVNVGSNGNQVHGLTISGTTGRALGNTSNVGTFTMSDVGVNTSATNAAAIAFTGGGTVTATGTNTLSSGTATALNVANTNIGASGMTFRSISSSGGTAPGIILDTTGGAGGLTVTGTGTAGSGGTIASKTGANASTSQGIGIYLNRTTNASFSRLQLNDFQNFALRAHEVNGLTLSNVVVSGINGNSAGDDEGSILLDDAGGTITISGVNVTGGFEDNLRVLYDNAVAGPAATFNVTGSTFRDLQAAGQNAQVNLRTTTAASASWNVAFNFTSACVFENDANTTPGGGTENWSDGILVTFEGPFQHNLNVQNSTFHHLFQGMDIASNFSADVGYVLKDNAITFTEGVAAIAIGNGSSSTAQSLLTALIQGNTIGTSGVANSGSRLGQGIVVDVRGEEAAQFTVHGNTIRRIEVGGIDVLANTGDGDLNIQITNNVIDEVEDNVGGGISDGMRVLTGTGSLHDICLDARNNDSFKIGIGAGDELQLRQSNTGVVFAIEGLTGPGTVAANVEAYLDSQNPLFNPADGGTRVRTVASVVNYTSVGSCPTPPTQ